MKNRIKKPELLAPAGNMSMLQTAINAGADAIYLGVQNLNMRALANNFSVEDLPSIVEICKDRGVKTHLTLNTIIYESELGEVDKIVKAAKGAGVDMIICWDLAVIQKCRQVGIPFCISTQASISNSESAKFYESLGAARIVLARECTLEKIREIRSKVKLEIETFVHGAMCVAISGRCFMSHEVYGKSANRGECLQPCRREYEIREYEIVDKDEGFSFTIGEGYVLSPKDLCTVGFIDKLIEAGIDSFKIEGRKRSPEYIDKTVATYRAAIDSYFEGSFTDEARQKYIEELSKVYNRGFSSGFYFGVPGKNDFVNAYGNVATTRKTYIGKVLNYYQKNRIAHIKIETGSLQKKDSVYIIGNATGTVETTIPLMMKDNSEVLSAARGDEITFYCNEKVRENDKVYKIVEMD